MKIKVIKVKNKEELGRQAANRVCDILHQEEKPVLGLATGSTPKPLYKTLIERYQKGEVSFKETTTFNLDEYVGLSAEDSFSYRYYMEKHLFEYVDIKKENVYIPDGLANDLQAECQRFEQAIQKVGPIHLQILGVGLNGHIGFNEPGTSFHSRTHVAELEESTRRVNSRFFNSLEEVPKQALTMGIGTIMEAEEVMLLVQGEHKAEILEKIVYGEVTENVPASVLQNHPNAYIITDIDL